MLFTKWTVQDKFIQEMKANGMDCKSIIIWDKKAHSMGDLQRSFGSRYESILWFPTEGFCFPRNRPVDIISYPRVSQEKLVHPNEKPARLLELLIEQVTKEGATVLDFTMGSGSTGVACVNTKRNFIGIEIDDNYFEIARKRIEYAEKELQTWFDFSGGSS